MHAVNLTPHTITIVDEAGAPTLTVPPSGQVARAQTTRKTVGEVTVDGVRVPVTAAEFGEVDGLPEPQEGTIYLVSRIVADACPDRDDLYGVDGAIRGEGGTVAGATALTRFGR